MKSFSTFLAEEVTIPQLKDLEKILDRAFKAVDIDINWTNHFIDRVNDKRNGKPITTDELRDIFLKALEKHKAQFGKMPDGFEAVLNDIQTKINLPFIIKYDGKNDEFDLVAKTVMRKVDFKTTTPKIKV